MGSLEPLGAGVSRSWFSTSIRNRHRIAEAGLVLMWAGAGVDGKVGLTLLSFSREEVVSLSAGLPRFGGQLLEVV